jgi:protein gp37
MGSPNYARGFELATHAVSLEIPLRWRKPRHIFVNSMSDLFHENLEFSFIRRVFGTMNQAYWHRFQVLTKRAQQLAKYSERLPWADNIWMGVSVETNEYLWRADCLKGTGAALKFLSLEPLLGPLPELDLSGIDWVIVGGESGPGARPLAEEWVVEIRDRCQASEVPFFFKQWGGFNKKRNGRELEGQYWDQFPTN